MSRGCPCVHWRVHTFKIHIKINYFDIPTKTPVSTIWSTLRLLCASCPFQRNFPSAFFLLCLPHDSWLAKWVKFLFGCILLEVFCFWLIFSTWPARFSSEISLTVAPVFGTSGSVRCKAGFRVPVFFWQTNRCWRSAADWPSLLKGNDGDRLP